MRKVEWVISIFLFLLVFPAFYSIFNVGNPNSIFRFFIKDSAYDISFTLAICGFMAILAIVLYTLRLKKQNPLIDLLRLNIEYIKVLKSNGKTNEEIADSFLHELSKGKGLLYKIAKRRVINFLIDLDKD